MTTQPDNAPNGWTSIESDPATQLQAVLNRLTRLANRLEEDGSEHVTLARSIEKQLERILDYPL